MSAFSDRWRWNIASLKADAIHHIYQARPIHGWTFDPLDRSFKPEGGIEKNPLSKTESDDEGVAWCLAWDRGDRRLEFRRKPCDLTDDEIITISQSITTPQLPHVESYLRRIASRYSPSSKEDYAIPGNTTITGESVVLS